MVRALRAQAGSRRIGSIAVPTLFAAVAPKRKVAASVAA
jgi:hypothetical protein